MSSFKDLLQQIKINLGWFDNFCRYFGIIEINKGLDLRFKNKYFQTNVDLKIEWLYELISFNLNSS